MDWEFCLRGTSWANLKMMMAVIPEIKSIKDEDDNDKKSSSPKNKKSEVQNSLEEAGF